MRTLFFFLLLCATARAQMNFAGPAMPVAPAPVVASGFTPDTNGLIAWYRFREGSGTTVADSSGNGQTGTFSTSPAPVWTNGVPGDPVGGAVHFDGLAGESITNIISAFPGSGAATNITVTCWFYSDQALQSNPYAGIWSTRANGGQLGLYVDTYPSPPCVNGSFTGSEYFHQTGDGVDQTNWVFCAMTFQAPSAYDLYYVTNGTSAPAEFSSSIIDPPQTANGAWFIGLDSNQASRVLNGRIADCRIYNRALSSNEVWGVSQKLQ